MVRTKITVVLSIDRDIKAKAMDIIQNKLGDSMSSYVNDKLRELVESHNSNVK